MKRLFGAFLLMGTAMLIASEEPSAESEIFVEESEIVVVDQCFFTPVSDYVDKYLVRLEKTVPSLVPVNEDFSYNYIVTAKDKLKKVVVEDQIPVGATYVSSSPTAQIDGDTVIWTLYNLEKDEIVPLELIVNASTVSDFTNCATVVAHPEACTTTTVGVAALVFQKTTPLDSVLIGADVPWKLTIENTGSICARNVVVTDVLPEGLSHLSGDNNQVIEIGILTPGESREINIDSVAAKAGEYCNVAIITASNADSVEDEFCIVILESGIEITMEGPEMQFVGKKATYSMTVTNTGDIPFSDVVITDTVPAGGKLLSAEGAEINGNTAKWITDFAAGEEKSFEVDFLVMKDGDYCNEASVSTVDSSLNTSASACTEWRGYPALLIEVIDTQDPLIVGEETTYIIQIANQGSAADTNVNLDVQIPEGLSIISIAGDTEGVITGNDISFVPYPVLNAKEIIQFRVIVKAVDTGDLRFKAQMSSDLLQVPVPEEESTQAY
ncbi:MAG: putative repeat protein (TIGR01451 family) [Lentimonas sp.]|jgi:uncharacterized repeat protein (TIGR01451 family)